MPRHPITRSLILASLVLTAAACGTTDGLRTAPGRALIVYAADRGDDAQAVAERLRGAGLAVDLEPAGGVRRSGSSAAVYLAARHPGRIATVEEAVAPHGVDVLPFVHGGPPGSDVVIWLESR